VVDKIPPKHPSPFRNLAWGFALAGSLLLTAGGIIYIVNQSWRIHAQIGGGIGLMLVLSAVLLRPDAIRTFLAGRPVKYASHAIVKSVAFLGILILINFLAVTYGGEIDLSETGQFTLSEATNRHIWLTPMQISVAVISTLIIIPLAILIVGVVMWWKRR